MSCAFNFQYQDEYNVTPNSNDTDKKTSDEFPKENNRVSNNVRMIKERTLPIVYLSSNFNLVEVIIVVVKVYCKYFYRKTKG